MIDHEEHEAFKKSSRPLRLHGDLCVNDNSYYAEILQNEADCVFL